MRLAGPGLVSFVDRLAAAFGVHAVLRRRRAGSLTVLMYHRVLPDRLVRRYPLSNLVVRESNFARQMRWLSRNVDVVPVRDALKGSCGPTMRGRPRVALTFDDGYRDNLEVAVPHLTRHGMKATFFVTTGFVEGGAMWFDVAASAFHRLGAPTCSELVAPGLAFADLSSFMTHLKGLDPSLRLEAVARLRERAGPLERGLLYDALTSDQVRQLHRLGHEIGSHSCTHPILTQLGGEDLQRELESSRRRIEEWTGVTPVGFCYPNGNSSDGVRSAVISAGYDYACTTGRGVNEAGTDPFLLRRWMISETSTSTESSGHMDDMFAAEVLGLHGLLRDRVWKARPVVPPTQEGAEGAPRS